MTGTVLSRLSQPTQRKRPPGKHDSRPASFEVTFRNGSRYLVAPDYPPRPWPCLCGGRLPSPRARPLSTRTRDGNFRSLGIERVEEELADQGHRLDRESRLLLAHGGWQRPAMTDPLFIPKTIDCDRQEPKRLLHRRARLLVQTLDRVLARNGELEPVEGLVERRRKVSLSRVRTGPRHEDVPRRRL